MQEMFKNKVALITGGARGIGRAIACRLAAAGADIAIVYYNSSDEAALLVEELQQQGRRAIALQANVADESSVMNMAQAFLTHFDKVDFLISNAASGVLKPEMLMSTKHWRWCMETNALGSIKKKKTNNTYLWPCQRRSCPSSRRRRATS